MSRDKLSERWERYAQSDAEFYIWTDVEAGDDFAASGERDAARIMALCAPHLAGRGRALEIGCGVGRLVIPMSRHFERIIGVDIAPTMLRKLADNCRRDGVTGVTGMLAHEAWDAQGPIDFAYSHIVLQHIESWATIESYVARVAGALSADGVFYAQFDSRPPNVLYHLRNRLPDSLLPRHYRRGVRRIRRSVPAIEQLAATNGFAVAHRSGEGTEQMILVLTRRAATA